MTTRNFSLNELRGFTGSEQFFKHGINPKLIYTEGVQHLAEQAGCYWLIDDIACVLLPYLLNNCNDYFYSLEMLVQPDHSAVITVGDGNGKGKILLTHTVKWTDFPIVGEVVQLYLCESENHYCLMLPSEY